jgi:hypothetical protein
MVIDTFCNVETCMGELVSNTSLSFLSKEEVKEFNLIGYSGKNSKGEKSNYEQYLNSLSKGEFAVTKTLFDDGTFREKFTIVRVT